MEGLQITVIISPSDTIYLRKAMIFKGKSYTWSCCNKEMVRNLQIINAYKAILKTFGTMNI